MSLPQQLFAPSFRRQRASLLFRSVVAFMVFTATLAIAGQMLLSAVTYTWDADLQSRLTVEIPAGDDETTIADTERVRQAMAIINTMPAVTNARVKPRDETEKLLSAWITDAKLLQSIPLPTLIEIERDNAKTLTADDLRSHLMPIIKDVVVDDHANWVRDMERLETGVIVMTTVLSVLAALTLIFSVSLFCRAVIAGEKDTITLLHIMGAHDLDIARHFQMLAARLARPAAALGFAVAIPAMGLFLFFLQQVVDFTTLTPLHWAALGLGLLIVPTSAVVLASFSARHSITRLLQALP